MSESTQILCVECKMSMPDTDPCPECGRKVCAQCFDPMEGVCLGCPGEDPLSHEGHPIPRPGVLEAQTSDVLQAVDRRIEAFRREQAIARADHLQVIRTMLNEHGATCFPTLRS